MRIVAAIFGMAAAALAAAGPARAQAQSDEARRLEWRECGWPEAAADGTRCGLLVVPQSRRPAGNPAIPGSPTIKVFFAIYAPTGPGAPLADPLVVLPGGPGAMFNPPVPYVMAGLAELRRQRAVIVMDQRGVGRSEPRLACDGAERQMRRNPVGCLEELKARGIDPAAFNSEETARDLADLRRALGIRQWNALGASYAARVVLRLGEIDALGTRSVVAMASLPIAPSLARDDSPRLRRALLDRLFADCAADADCAAAHGDLAAKLAQVEAIIRAGRGAAPPALAEAFDALAGIDRRAHGIAAALIRRLDWSDELPRLPRDLAALHAIATGAAPFDRARVEAIYTAPNRLPPIDRGLIGAPIRCQEDVLPEAAQGTDGAATPRPRGTCAFFAAAPVKSAPPGLARPILILTGAYDIRTLTVWSDQIAAHYPHAVLARLGDAGHDVSYRHPCGTAIMNAFVAAPLARPDLACATAHARPKFAGP